MTPAAPTVFFGVGATKAGSSWLHDMLAGHPEVHFREIKELHYFSMFDFGIVEQRRRKVTRLRDKARARLPLVPAAKRARIEKVQRTRDAYLALCDIGKVDAAAYLAFLHDGIGPETKLVGEVTPAYSNLSVDRLKYMATIAPRTKFVFIMRDPVARLWSHVRMLALRHVDGDGQGAMTTTVADILDRSLAGEVPGILERGDYPAIIARLRQAVPSEDLLIIYYEEMFSPECVDRICTFLGIAPHTFDPDRQVHKGIPVEMTRAQRDKMRDGLSDQYDGVAAAMGHLPDAWTRNMTAGAM